jgi:hypothetical protein
MIHGYGINCEYGMVQTKVVPRAERKRHMHTVRLKMAGKTDRNDNDYYLLVARLPMTIDLMNAVILVHPYEDDDGSFGAQMTIRKDTFKEKHPEIEDER